MFSVTGNILSGSPERRDVVTTVSIGKSSSSTSSSTYSYLANPLDTYGQKPIISTFTGLARSFLGIIHAIIHAVASIFDKSNQTAHRAEAKLGLSNFGKGLLEMVPCFGNLGALMLNEKKKRNYDSIAFKVVQDPTIMSSGIVKYDYKDKYSNSSTLFINGKEIASIALDKFHVERKKLPADPSAAQVLAIYTTLSPGIVIP